MWKLVVCIMMHCVSTNAIWLEIENYGVFCCREKAWTFFSIAGGELGK